MKVRRTILKALTDWLLIACLIGAFIGVDQIYPASRPFSPTDQSLMYPFIKKGITLTGIIDKRTYSHIGNIYFICCTPSSRVVRGDFDPESRMEGNLVGHSFRFLVDWIMCYPCHDHYKSHQSGRWTAEAW